MRESYNRVEQGKRHRVSMLWINKVESLHAVAVFTSIAY